MWKQRAVTLCGCLAILPLLMGCANGGGESLQASAPPPAAISARDAGGAPVYAIEPGFPAAVLVMLPSPGDALSADPRLWAAQASDVATPSPFEMYRIAAGRQAALARLVAEAQAIAAAPVWQVGANPAIAAAISSTPPLASGEVSGVVVTSTRSGAGGCSERMIYSDPGNGAPPKVSVSKSGNACPAGPPFGAAPSPALTPPLPASRPNAPRVIEAAAPASANAGAAVRQVADLIKSTSPNWPN